MGKQARQTPREASPEQLYLQGGLPRHPNAVPGLWLQQGDVIRAYPAHENTADLALELPTGTGKTLPALLIAEWIRRDNNSLVAYATPTVQLAEQVMQTAEREGIPAVQLTGSYSDWDALSEARYVGGDAVAVTTYSTIFNSSPKLEQPRLLIFDDAHAADQFVGSQYAAEIDRREDPNGYLSVITALGPLLDPLVLQRLTFPPADGSSLGLLRLLYPGAHPAVVAALDAALSGVWSQRFARVMLRDCLPACCVYVTATAISIRPLIPPTSTNRIFRDAKQRIYLSATLGSAGELERAFGRTGIVRLGPTGPGQPRSGRRFFVFPELTTGAQTDQLTTAIISSSGKAVVLTQDTVDAAERTALDLAPQGMGVFGREFLKTHGLSSFAAMRQGVLGLANRFDGLDLPGDACRVVVLDGLPDATSLQDRFLSERANAQTAMAERLRARVVQGAGRCTRGPNDYAVVVIKGTDLTRYFAKPAVKKALEPELQMEVEFGYQNSANQDPDDVLQNAKEFLRQSDLWRNQGEPAVQQFRPAAGSLLPPGSQALEDAAPFEVNAWEQANRGEWLAASATMLNAVWKVAEGGEATRGYRALLLFFASCWQQMGATSESHRAAARDLRRQAVGAAGKCTWIAEVSPLPDDLSIGPQPTDLVAIQTITHMLADGSFRPVKTTSAIGTAVQNLTNTDAAIYEQALVEVGLRLGADSSKPKGQGRCDAAWIWGNQLWITLEAKSEQHDQKTLPLKDLRQANTQLDQLAADLGAATTPAGSVSVIISPRLTVDPRHAPAANANLFLAGTDDVLRLARDVQAAWTELVASPPRDETPAARQRVGELLSQFGCLPSQVLDRLTQTRIRP